MMTNRTVFALSALALFLASGCTKTNTGHDPVEKISPDSLRVYRDALENIKTEKAHVAPFPELLSLMGKISVTKDRTTVVPARVSGRMEGVFFASGEHVTQGQPLMSLFSPDFIAAKWSSSTTLTSPVTVITMSAWPTASSSGMTRNPSISASRARVGSTSVTITWAPMP